MKLFIKSLSAITALTCALGTVQAQELTLDDVIKAGIDYMVTEYALDQVQYTACGLTLAKKIAPANFEKTKREFISVFDEETRKKLDRFFHGEEMKGLKDAVSYQGIMGPIQKAKSQGKNMDVFCDRELDKLISINAQTKRNWLTVKGKLQGG